MRPTGTRVTFSGSPLRIPVGADWLGRVCNGRGDPIDGGPPITGDVTMPVAGSPINPVLREPPAEPVLTGISVIDSLTTLVRGQKLPVFSVAGLPHLELAAQLAAQASVGGDPFSVVFAAMGLTHADASAVRAVLEERSAAGELALLLNLADAPVIERILTPRLALTVAERLAFTLGRHVLVVMADMTSYCEALREVSAARGEIPARRAYPGYLYSDLASLYERCGRIRGMPGSVTVVPVLTMPAGDITHPVPDLTGYITEGQIVLSPEIHARGVYPPVDALSSLSRLMRHGAGPGRTRDDHLDVAAQTLAALAAARRASELAELLGTTALSPLDQQYLELATAFERQFMNQGRAEDRSLEESLSRAWRVLATLPRRQLTMLPARFLDAYYPGRDDQGAGGSAVSRRGFTVPPGRAGRLWLTRRLQVARRGADLLDRKLRILQAELARFRDSEARTAAEWDRCCADAERWLLRASMLGGERAVRLAADGQPATVTIPYTVTMGVRHPASPACVIPASVTWDGPTLTRTRQAHAAALEAAVRHAAAAEALRVIEAEVLATRYRLRAIEDRWIPRLEQALAEVTFALEEQELADAARLRLAIRSGRPDSA